MAMGNEESRNSSREIELPVATLSINRASERYKHAENVSRSRGWNKWHSFGVEGDSGTRQCDYSVESPVARLRRSFARALPDRVNKMRWRLIVLLPRQEFGEPLSRLRLAQRINVAIFEPIITPALRNKSSSLISTFKDVQLVAWALKNQLRS